MENIVQSCCNNQDFVNILKHPLFLSKRCYNNEILWICKKEVKDWKCVKKMVGLFISFAANVAQSCRNE